jgi:hypothetical protein
MILQITQQGEDVTRTVGTEEEAEQLNKEHKKALS